MTDTRNAVMKKLAEQLLGCPPEGPKSFSDLCGLTGEETGFYEHRSPVNPFEGLRGPIRLDQNEWVTWTDGESLLHFAKETACDSIFEDFSRCLEYDEEFEEYLYRFHNPDDTGAYDFSSGILPAGYQRPFESQLTLNVPYEAYLRVWEARLPRSIPSAGNWRMIWMLPADRPHMFLGEEDLTACSMQEVKQVLRSVRGRLAQLDPLAPWVCAAGGSRTDNTGIAPDSFGRLLASGFSSDGNPVECRDGRYVVRQFQKEICFYPELIRRSLPFEVVPEEEEFQVPVLLASLGDIFGDGTVWQIQMNRRCRFCSGRFGGLKPEERADALARLAEQTWVTQPPVDRRKIRFADAYREELAEAEKSES